MKNIKIFMASLLLLLGQQATSQIGFRLTNRPQLTLNLTSANMLADGNSYTEGYLATTPWPTLLKNALEAAPYYVTGLSLTNVAVSGQTTLNMITRAPTYVTPVYNGARLNILFAWEVGNGIGSQGIDGAVENFKTYCNARRAEGWKVIALTTVPRINVSDTLLVPANARLLAEWQSYCDMIIDLRSDSRLATISGSYWNGDNVHLNDAGYAVVADIVIKKLTHLQAP